jgi:hypothetical protein
MSTLTGPFSCISGPDQPSAPSVLTGTLCLLSYILRSSTDFQGHGFAPWGVVGKRRGVSATRRKLCPEPKENDVRLAPLRWCGPMLSCCTRCRLAFAPSEAFAPGTEHRATQIPRLPWPRISFQTRLLLPFRCWTSVWCYATQDALFSP